MPAENDRPTRRPLGAAERRPLGAAECRPLGAAERRPLGAAERRPLGAAERRPLGAAERRRFRARQCAEQGGCGLRFPVEDGSPLGASCPHCGKPTVLTGEAYEPLDTPRTEVRPHAARLGALLDNVRSLRNTGSLFRTADGAGVELIVLGGVTPTPTHPGFAKTALGAESSVPWRTDVDAVRAAAACVTEGWELWALEGGPRATSLFEPGTLAAARDRPVMLVVGHEVSGIDPRIVELCTRVVFLPMAGVKGSLNVSVAFGIAAYVLRYGVA